MHFSVNTIGNDPVNGFTPQVVVGLTNEQDSDSANSGIEGFGIKKASPGGSTFPLTAGAQPYYVVATLDSGSQGDIISYDDAQVYDFAGAGFEGGKTQTVQGVSGSEDLAITDAVGVYMTDFSNATVTGGKIGVAAGTLQGQYNVPLLAANQGDSLPNLMGSPILSQYRATIQNSQQRHLTVGGTTFTTPAVTLSNFSSTIPAGYSKLTLQTTDSGPPDSPYYINFDLTGPKNPDSPGAWTSLITNSIVSMTHGANTVSNQPFLFDTGAQLSLISNDTAASLGIFNVSPANADFVVQAEGVGGIIDVPGYYVNTLSFPTQGGNFSWNHVPVLVLDVADPRNPSNPIPGILGTNLFNDRDLIINANIDATGQTYVAFGPRMAWNPSGSGTWNTASNWAVVMPNGIDMQANFYGSITAASTVTVSSPVTVGSITFDNANRYTVAGSSGITMSVSTNPARITVASGSHTISAPLILASDTTTTVVPAASTLTVSSVVSSSSGAHGITKDGQGTLLLTGHNTYTGETVVQGGAMELGVNARDPVLTLAGGADVQGGRLLFDYTSGNDPATTVAALLHTSHTSGFATGQIRSTTADATHGLGWNDDSVSQVTVAYALYGDTNLDGAVNVGDLGALATSYGISSGAIWSQGDFNYDGAVDVGDLGALATNYGSSLTGGGAAAAAGNSNIGAVSIPEPSALGVLGMCIIAGAGRRRRLTR
jgi:autotransporter-associated beta strand protein